jgi:Mor family transcriptional regulator
MKIKTKEYMRNKITNVEQEDAIVSMYQGGSTLLYLSKQFDVSAPTIRNIILRRNLTLRKKGRKRRGIVEKIKVKTSRGRKASVSSEQESQIVNRFISLDRNVSATAKEFNVSRFIVINVLNKNNIIIPQQCKIAPIYFPIIKEKYDEGEKVSDLARQYGVTILTIYNILNKTK